VDSRNGSAAKAAVQAHYEIEPDETDLVVVSESVARNVAYYSPHMFWITVVGLTSAILVMRFF
jgi:spore maturation protein SpmB